MRLASENPDAAAVDELRGGIKPPGDAADVARQPATTIRLAAFAPTAFMGGLSGFSGSRLGTMR
jgi:hypothetical protein